MKLITLLICFLMPVRISFWLLNLLGHKLSRKSGIGFSFLWVEGKLILGEGSRIGHFNLIRTKSLKLDKGAGIGNFNKMTGPIDFELSEQAAIGNSNKFYRAKYGVTYGDSVLRIGRLAKITGAHRIDCTRSVVFGDYSILAGHDSQLWTHAYYHDKSGPGRFRVDGEITIGKNVYIGSRCVINCGIRIADAVVVGSNSNVSRSLTQAGTYVSQPLRYIPEQEQDPRGKFEKIEGFDLCEEVYERKV